MHFGDQRQAGLRLGRRPLTRRRRVQWRSQGAALSASDIHNARTTIRNPVYNMESKIKKIGQNETWFEVDIPCINVTSDPYNALASAIFFCSNGVTIPFQSMMSQSHHKEAYSASTREWGWNRIELHGSPVEYNFISSCTGANPWMFNSVYIRDNRMKLFQIIVAFLLPRILKSNGLQHSLKTAGVI